MIVEGSLSYYKSTTKEGEQKLTASVKAGKYGWREGSRRKFGRKRREK